MKKLKVHIFTTEMKIPEFQIGEIRSSIISELPITEIYFHSLICVTHSVKEKLTIEDFFRNFLLHQENIKGKNLSRRQNWSNYYIAFHTTCWKWHPICIKFKIHVICSLRGKKKSLVLPSVLSHIHSLQHWSGTSTNLGWVQAPLGEIFSFGHKDEQA